MAKFTQEDDALLEELGIEVETKKATSRTPREERIIAGFEEVQRFVEEHRTVPCHGEDRDIFERLYAVRLDRLRELEECRTLLEPLDHQGLLTGAEVAAPAELGEIDDDALLAELGVATEAAEITELRHVRSSAEKRAAEEIANREKCEDFAAFEPLFDQVKQDLEGGVRTTREFVKDVGFLKADIEQGQFFIVGGQIAYVADVGDTIKAPNGETDARLRVIYDNGTESRILLRSLQRALYKDEAGRRISDRSAGPLFKDVLDDEDHQCGTIYVLRSRSDNPVIAANREIIHKIGVTGGNVDARIANASIDATFLLADVEVVATYVLVDINRSRLETLLHKFFAAARLDLEIKDRFGRPVRPREWFLVPLPVINEVVERIKDQTITEFTYDPSTALLQKMAS